MTNEELLVLKKLDQLYEDSNKTGPMILNSACVECGTRVRIEIHKTLSGYGINGGSVLVTGDRLSVKCIACW